MFRWMKRDENFQARYNGNKLDTWEFPSSKLNIHIVLREDERLVNIEMVASPRFNY